MSSDIEKRTRSHKQIELATHVFEQAARFPDADVSETNLLIDFATHVEQTHALIPVIVSLNKLGHSWKNQGVIQGGDGKALGRLALSELVQKNSASESLKLIQNNQIFVANTKKAQATLLRVNQNAENPISEDRINIALQHIGRLPDLFVMRDTLKEISRNYRIMENNAFKAAWLTMAKIAESEGVEGPLSQNLSNIMPVIPESPDSTKTQFVVTRWVLADMEEQVKKELVRLQQKAQKLGLPEPQMRFTGNEKIFELPVYQDGEEVRGVTLPALKREVKFSGGMPRFDGAKFIAKIDHEKQSDDTYLNLVATPQGDQSPILKKWGGDLHVCTPSCEHCDTNRERKTTFIVEDKGELKQIGSTCVDDFIGKKTLAQVIGSFDLHSFFQKDNYWDEMDQDFGNGGKEPIWFPIQTFIEMADYLTRTKGFFKSDQEFATRDVILSAIQHPSKAPAELRGMVYQAFDENNTTPSKNDYKKMHSFFSGMQSDSTYVKNIQSLLQREYLRLDNRLSTGILASVPSAYHRHVEKTNPNNEPVKNEAFGKKGARGSLKLRVNGIEDNPHAEYPYIKYRMTDDDGRKMVWKASYPGTRALKVGGTFVLNATIKNHSEFKGTHYTSLSRCADFENVRAEHPIPNFEAGVKKRAFKEKFSFALDYKDDRGKVTGEGHLRIERRWKEKGALRECDFSIPLPLDYDFETSVLAQMESITQVDRMGDNGYEFDTKVDKKFMAALQDASRPYQSENLKLNPEWFLVEDASLPLLDARQRGSDHSAREPRVFQTLEEAEVEATKHRLGRISKVVIDNNIVALAPAELRLVDKGIQERFRNEASKQGAQTLLYVKGGTNETFDEGEPLSWTPDKLNNGIDVLWSLPAHKGKTGELNPRLYSGLKLATISGSSSNLAIMQKIKDAISSMDAGKLYDYHQLFPDIITQVNPQSGATRYSVPLSYITNDDNRKLHKDTRALFAVDETTPYYLKNQGADVLDIRIALPGEIERNFDDDTVVLELRGDETIVELREQIVERATEALNDPNRDHKRVRGRRNS
jgi:hypothetical protein